MDDRDLYAAIRSARELQPEPLRWLWPGRIPAGCLTLLIGDPGTGKSLLVADLAARVSAGLPWPDQPATALPRREGSGEGPVSAAPSRPSASARHRGGVLLLTPEDPPTDTVLPRLTAARANCDQIAFCDGATVGRPPPDRPSPSSSRWPLTPRSLDRSDYEGIQLMFPDHLPVLAQAVRAITFPRLVVLDPLHALLSPGAQSSSACLAQTLAGLADIAQAYSVAILAVGHLSKNHPHRTLYRVRGSLALVAAARAVHLLTDDATHVHRRILLSLKNVHGPRPAPLAFDIVSGPRLAWVPGGADLRSPGPPPDLFDLAPDARSALVDACAWLTDFLAAGPRPFFAVQRAARAAGLTFATLHRAKRLLRIRSFKPVNESPWLWSLPGHSDNQGAQEGGVQIDLLRTFEPPTTFYQPLSAHGPI